MKKFNRPVFLMVAFLLTLTACNKRSPTLPDTQPPPKILQGDFFVSPQGNDANDGKSPSSPLRTVKKALERAKGGETIVILKGIYHETIELANYTPPQRITIQGENAQTGRSEDQPVFDGENSKQFFVNCLGNCTNITVEYLTIQNYRWTGLLFFQSSNIQLRHLHIIHTGLAWVPDLDDWGDGLRLDECSHCLVENTIIENTGGISSDNELHGHGIVLFGTTNTTIRNNKISNIKGDGMVVEDSCHIVVEGNEITDVDVRRATWFGGAIDTDGGIDITIRNNIIRNSNGPGINIGDEEIQYPERSKGWKVDGNTIEGHKFGLYIWNFGKCPPTDDILQATNNTYANNEQDVFCVAWLCRRDEPCFEPDPSPPPC